MPQVSYALRDDPCSIYLLQDAGNKYDKYCQIAVFCRSIIRPEFFRQYISFAPFVGAYEKNHNDVTKVRFSIEDNELVPSNNYVAMIDSEVEFNVNPSVIKQLSRDYIPSFTVKSYFNYFSNCKTGFLLFLRVYKVNQELPPSLLENGVRGGSKILRFYDEHGDKKSVDIDGLTPVVSDNKFSYLKDEILHMLKVSNSFITLFDSTNEGLERLQRRVEVERLFSGVHQFWEYRYVDWLKEESSENNEPDMAHLDYDEIFREVLKICPGMAATIDYIKKVQPVRRGEYDYLFNIIFNDEKDKELAISRLFDVGLRSAVKAALYAYQKQNVELEDAFQVCCIGLITAIQRYNVSVKGLFPSYASMWMQQLLSRECSPYDYNVRVPAHFAETLNNIIRLLEKKVGVSDFKTVEFTELYHFLLKYTKNNDKALRLSFVIYYIILPPISIEAIIDSESDDENNYNEKYLDKNLCISDDDYLDIAFQEILRSDVNNLISVLTERQREVIQYRFGLNGLGELTLEEIGKLYGVTRERVRQIEVKAIQRIQGKRASLLRDFITD